MQENCVWPSGNDKPVCVINYGHEEFARKAGLYFESGTDDLDEYFGNIAFDVEIGPMKFLEYLNAPMKGITAYVDSMVQTSKAVAAIKRKFKLIDVDIVWTREIEN